MTINNIIAEIEEDFKAYKAAGLIDKGSLYRWAYSNLKKFGQSICELTETTIEIVGGQAQLPDGFHSIHLAAKCNLSSYYCKEEDLPVIQNTIMWKEKIERKTTGISCSPCCVDTTEKIITENILINDRAISFYYEAPTLLRLGKGMKKNNCSTNCRNLVVRDSPYEIVINKQTLYTNFDCGTVYIQYYGLPIEDGVLSIPDTPRGELATFIEYALKARLVEKIIGNGDDPNLVSMLQYYNGKEKIQFALAMSDAKFATLTPDSYRRLALYNRGKMAQIQYMLPSF